MNRSLLIAATLFVALAASAQPTVSPSIRAVVSGGYWKQSDRVGTYRAIVTCEGWEQVSCQLFVQWVAEPKSPEAEQTVVASVEAKLPYGNEPMSFDVQLRPIAIGRVAVTVSGVHSLDPNRRIRATFLATAAGTLSQAKERPKR